jgi:hypothetical protein
MAVSNLFWMLLRVLFEPRVLKLLSLVEDLIEDLAGATLSCGRPGLPKRGRFSREPDCPPVEFSPMWEFSPSEARHLALPQLSLGTSGLPLPWFQVVPAAAQLSLIVLPWLISLNFKQHSSLAVAGGPCIYMAISSRTSAFGFLG